MVLSEIIDNYEKHIATSKSLNSCIFEKYLISILLKYLDKIELESITTLDLDKMIGNLKDIGTCGNITINRAINELKTMLRFSDVKNIQVERYKPLIVVQKHYQIISKENLKKIFHYLDNLSKTYNNLIYKLYFYILADTGMRGNECLNINISDVNLTERTILLRNTKNHKERVVVFKSDKLYRLIQEYLLIPRKKDIICYNYKRKRNLSKEDIKMFLRTLKKKLNIEVLHSHMFRHTYATHMIEEGLGLDILKCQLGHSSIITTQVYLHQSLKKRIEEIGKIPSYLD